jgi:acetyl-CoA decarbonylase/synthase, CODH/ACS complex subunit beta
MLEETVSDSLGRQAVDELLRLLPDEPLGFSGSQFAAPVRTAILGDRPLDLGSLRRELIAKSTADAKELLSPLLLAAEAVEAARDDKEAYFIDDAAVQELVFMGAKWQAGWALVLGRRHTPELLEELKRRDYLVFTDQPDIADTRFIGARSTSPIYFLQLMVRYGLIWGGIAPGDDHELGHFLERDMPGLMIVTEDLAPLKYLVTLGLMKLGAPAVVPSSFPFPYGTRVLADSRPDIVRRGGEFPNLRRRYFEDELIALPAPLDRVNANVGFVADRRVGGGDSFFCLRPADQVGERLRVSGTPGDRVGILVEVAAEHLSDDVALTLEKAALRAVNYIPSLHVYIEGGALWFDLAAGAELDADLIGDAIYWGLRLRFPRLRQIATHVIGDLDLLAAMAAEVRGYAAGRDARVRAMNEQNTDEFVACIECRPFSLEHTCILTPGRLPMCASRTYASVKASAYFASEDVPWMRPTESGLPMRRVFAKGALLDAERGEYAGCNQVYEELTGGRLSKVYLHSLRDYPVTSCGCFQALAFWIAEVAGIGIMRRDAQGCTPTGETWTMLANRAGGKRSPGIAGVSLDYIGRPDFLKGDGGIGNVVWVNSGLLKLMARVAPGQKVATEQDVAMLAELAHFVGRPILGGRVE